MNFRSKCFSAWERFINEFTITLRKSKSRMFTILFRIKIFLQEQSNCHSLLAFPLLHSIKSLTKSALNGLEEKNIQIFFIILHFDINNRVVSGFFLFFYNFLFWCWERQLIDNFAKVKCYQITQRDVDIKTMNLAHTNPLSSKQFEF